MHLVDTALAKREAEKNPIRVGMIGAGFMAKGIANQIVNSVPGMSLVAIANRTLPNAVKAYSEAGITSVNEVSSVIELEDRITDGVAVVTEDPFLLCEAEGIDVLIDVTGAVEFGARVTMKAIECGKHMVSMNAELDATVGSVIQRKAAKAGVIYTLSDGDQPGVEMNLWRYVKGIGLTPLVCGNIKGLQDAYRNPTTQEEFAKKWGQNPYMVTSFADGSKISFEQACVANATGMQVEMRGMRGGDFEGHIDELCHIDRYDVDHLKSLGGVVDYTVKSTPSPGVFVLATHEDPKQKHMLDLYKLGKGPLYSFYTPYHLCHFEVPFSIARVVLFSDQVLAAVRPMVDVITVAKTSLEPGTTLDEIGGYHSYGQCENYGTTRSENLLPLGLANGCVLKAKVSKDQAISFDDIEAPEQGVAFDLWKEQLELF